MKIFISPNNKKIRLTDERESHILERHPEIKDYLHFFRETLKSPDCYEEGQEENIVAKKVDHRHLVIYYKEGKGISDSFIITAHLTSKVAKLKKLLAK